jgi:hypothetical protein
MRRETIVTKVSLGPGIFGCTATQMQANNVAAQLQTMLQRVRRSAGSSSDGGSRTGNLAEVMWDVFNVAH